MKRRKATKMRKLLMLGVALATLATATPAMARDAGLVVGGTAGGVTGGTIGFLLGGPIGAVIGGWTGAAIGASVLSDDDVMFIRDNPGRDLVLDADIDVGFVVGDDIRIRSLEGDDRYGYFRANGRIYIVDLDTREVVEIRRG
jgi:outer membrane lipoprotein SlyB